MAPREPVHDARAAPGETGTAGTSLASGAPGSADMVNRNHGTVVQEIEGSGTGRDAVAERVLALSFVLALGAWMVVALALGTT